jgi:hypothetical protein
MPMLRQRQIPKWAERRFAEMMSLDGVAVQRVGEDENGWDYLLEVSVDEHCGPAEEQPPWKTFYVQVKSTTGPRAVVTDLSLNNARKMAQHPSPWFLLLFHQTKNEGIRVYARHVWKELMEDFLKAVRVAGLASKKLNRVRRRVTFEASDEHGEGNDLLDWMEQCVRDIGPDYDAQKRELYRTVGYEKGAGTAKVTIGFPSLDHLQRGLLGMSDLEVKNFEYMPARFGVADPSKKIAMSSGVMTISPQPRGLATVQIQNPGGGAPLSFTGPFYALPHGFVGLPGTALIRASGIEVLLRADSTAALSAGLQLQHNYSFRDLEKFARLKGWLQSGGVRVSIMTDGQRIGHGRVEWPSDADYPWDQIAESAAYWHDVEGHAVVEGKSFNAALASFMIFARCLSHGTLLFQGSAKEVHEAQLLYSASAVCGGRRLHAIATRQFLAQEREEDTLRITFGHPTIVTMYVQDESDDASTERRANHFQALLENMQVPTIGLADLDVVARNPGEEITYQLHRPGTADEQPRIAP